MKGNLIKEVWPSIVNGRNLQSDPSLEGCRMSLLCVCHDAPRNGTVISDQFNIPSGPVLGVHLRVLLAVTRCCESADHRHGVLLAECLDFRPPRCRLSRPAY